MRSASLVILHETSFTIGFATNALLICTNLKPQTATFGSPFFWRKASSFLIINPDNMSVYLDIS